MSGTQSGKRGPGLVVGTVLVAMGAGIIASTAGMDVAPAYARVGPQVFPYAAGIAVALMGVYFLASTWMQTPDRILADTDETDWRAIGIIAASFVFVVLALKPVGFVITAALLFYAVTGAFGSRRYLRDVAIAVILSVAAFLIFTRLLNLQLPAGLLKGLL